MVACVEIEARSELTPTLSRYCPTASAPSFNNATVRVLPTPPFVKPRFSSGADALLKARTNGVDFADVLLNTEN